MLSAQQRTLAIARRYRRERESIVARARRVRTPSADIRWPASAAVRTPARALSASRRFPNTALAQRLYCRVVWTARTRSRPCAPRRARSSTKRRNSWTRAAAAVNLSRVNDASLPFRIPTLRPKTGRGSFRKRIEMLCENASIRCQTRWQSLPPTIARERLPAPSWLSKPELRPAYMQVAYQPTFTPTPAVFSLSANAAATRTETLRDTSRLYPIDRAC